MATLPLNGLVLSEEFCQCLGPCCSKVIALGQEEAIQSPRCPGLGSEYPGQAVGEATVSSGQTGGLLSDSAFLTRVAF